jgi:hypothetical protein
MRNRLTKSLDLRAEKVNRNRWNDFQKTQLKELVADDHEVAVEYALTELRMKSTNLKILH